MKAQQRVLTLDFETDPFAYGESVSPFVWDIFDGENHITYWGDDCISKLYDYLDSIEPALIFAHNGGKFDFMFLLEKIRCKSMLVIGSRIVEAKLGLHTIRDSYAILPVPQSKMDKGDIDYEKLRRDCRDSHRDEILKYLHRDTASLLTYVVAYRYEFGIKPKTMASAAIAELRKFHSYTRLSKQQDAIFREYFHGGRVECFCRGIIDLKGIKVYDVNSMYPSVMRSYLHPLSNKFTQNFRLTSRTNFVTFLGISRGALPIQDGETKRFPNDMKPRVWNTTIHEYRAGLETGTILVHQIIYTWECEQQGTFGDFINHFYDSRMSARKSGDAARELFYKLVMNSAYGKFAQNPERYYDYCMSGHDDAPEDQCWHGAGCGCGGWIMHTPPSYSTIMWRKKSVVRNSAYHNVATAASITGAARSVLLRAIVAAKTPLYCDTDSIICRGLNGVAINDNDLGAWKLEKQGDRIAIAGKKMYALFASGECVKQATKGVRLTPAQIVAVASGEIVEHCADAPNMKFDGSQKFTKRKVRMT